jgi:LacI family transcriptional regulator
MKAVLNEHGVDVPEPNFLFGEWSESWGYDAVGHLLEHDPTVDAIFCGSDIIARGVMDGLRERGRRIPEDIAIVGFDNWEIIATHARPPLTTVDMNLHDLGREAAQRLLARLEGDDAAGTIRLPCTLVVRESSGGVGTERANSLAAADKVEIS